MTVFYGMKGDRVICFHINARRYLISLDHHSESNTLQRLEIIENGKIKSQRPCAWTRARARSFAAPGAEVRATILYKGNLMNKVESKLTHSVNGMARGAA